MLPRKRVPSGKKRSHLGDSVSLKETMVFRYIMAVNGYHIILANHYLILGFVTSKAKTT